MAKTFGGHQNLSNVPSYCGKPEYYPTCLVPQPDGTTKLCPEVDTCEKYSGVTDVFGDEYYRTHKQTATRFQKDTQNLQERIKQICQPYCSIPNKAPEPQTIEPEKENVISDQVRTILLKFLEREPIQKNQRTPIDELPDLIQTSLPSEIKVIFALGKLSLADCIPTWKLEKIVKSMGTRWDSAPLFFKLWIIFGELTEQDMQNIESKVIKENKQQQIEELKLPTNEQIKRNFIKSKIEEVF